MKDKIREIVEEWYENPKRVEEGGLDYQLRDYAVLTDAIYQATRLDEEKVRKIIETAVYFPKNDGTSDYIGNVTKAICLQQDELTKEG